MRTNRSSTTAEGMAIVRAIESSRPANVRLFEDPFARSMINPVSYVLSKLVIDSGLYDRVYPGAFAFITVRERYIDDFLVARLREGLDQVVILGAGFDTRAYRIPGVDRTRVFEVDHPDTQRVKLAKLGKVLDPLPRHVAFVALDFDRQSLADGLRGAGYDERGRTLFIWQGVTMYLTREGVDRTLAFIAGHSAPGSAVIFDYFYEEFLRDERDPMAKRIRRALRVIGEELVFGIGEGQLERFFAERGFRDVRNADAEELRRLYLGPDAGRAIARGAAIASARVGGPG